MADLPDDDEVLDLNGLEVADDDEALPLDAADTGAADGEGPEADDEPVDIVIEGEAPPEAKPEGDALVRHLREVTKAQARELAALRAVAAPAPVEVEALDPGPKPTLESCGWDEDAKDEALIAWHEAKRAHDAALAKAKERQDGFKAQIEADVKRYQDLKSDLPGIDFDEVDAVVSSKLSVAHQLAVVRAADKPHLVMAALARHPAKLEAVSAINDPAKLGAFVARLEGAIKVSNMKRNPAPEKRIAGSAPVSGGAAEKHLERLRAAAAKTGDYSAVAAYKRQMAAR